MQRSRSSRAISLIMLLSGALFVPVYADEPAAKEKKTAGKAAEKWLIDKTLTVTPREAPVPALEYRLFPLASERKDGNAVPIYLRFAHERIDVTKKRLIEKPNEWNALPLDKLPLAEAREFLNGYRYNFRQLDVGARRKTAEWNYTLDEGSLIDLLLPDMAEMRMHFRLLVLKARVEIAEGNFAESLRTLETGFSFCRQVAESPFLISALVGIAGCGQFADCVTDLMEQPKGPNLYWALTALPRPLIDLRVGIEQEQRIAEHQFPDLADIGRARSPAEWQAALTRVRKEMQRILRKDDKIPGTRSPTEPAEESPDLPAGKKYLVATLNLPAEKVDAMPAAQVLLLFLMGQYRQHRDNVYKAAYLPFPQSGPVVLEAEKQMKDAPATEGVALANMLVAAVLKVQMAQVRLERRIAALRVIEALRIYAATHDGQLPEKLSQLVEVPVPLDPGTDQPFEYQRDGEVAVLSSRIPGEPLATTGMRFRVKMRK